MMITTTSLGDAHSSMARKLFHDCSSVHAATWVRMLSPPTYLRDTSFDKEPMDRSKSILLVPQTPIMPCLTSTRNGSTGGHPLLPVTNSTMAWYNAHTNSLGSRTSLLISSGPVAVELPEVTAFPYHVSDPMLHEFCLAWGLGMSMPPRFNSAGSNGQMRETSPLATFYPPRSGTTLLDHLGPSKSSSIQESFAVELPSLILLSAYSYSSQALDETLRVGLV
jgi:hypothetical protein